MNEQKSIEIPDELLAKYDNVNKNPAMKLKDAVKDFYSNYLKGKKVEVTLNNGVLEVMFENDGMKKSVGWRMKPDKAATFERLLQMTEGAEYAYSEQNRDTNEATSIPRFHYYISDAVVGGRHIPVKIQVRDIVTGKGSAETHYYTHNLLNEKAGSDSPAAGADRANIDGNAYTPALTENTIAQPSNIVKSVPGLVNNVTGKNVLLDGAAATM